MCWIFAHAAQKPKGQLFGLASQGWAEPFSFILSESVSRENLGRIISVY